MTLRLNSTGGGYVEIDAPNTASNFSLTAPIANGTLDTTGRAGNILQVKQTHLTTRFSVVYNAGTDFDIPGLNVTLTPSSTNNKILIFARLQFEINNIDFQDTLFNLTRNSTFVGKTSDAPGSRKTGLAGPCSGYYNADASSTQDSMSFNYLDSPNSTSALTYQVNATTRNGDTMFINRAVNDTDTVAYEWMTSSITAMEVAG
jgi:hypothetical protein